jgi:hypothetical protein
MAATLYSSYDVTGTAKESFENQISLLSPTEVPFQSMIRKMAISNTVHQWAQDELVNSAQNAQKEGFAATDLNAIGKAPIPKVTYTQIVAKSVQVSDTANSTDLHGRKQAYAYQMKKKGMEIKKDLERALLRNPATTIGTATTARGLGGFEAVINDSLKATSATATFTEDEIFALTEKLYTEGAKATVVMVHPSQMKVFSKFQEIGSQRTRIFDNMDTTLNVEVNTLIDPLGQTLKVIPNREMPLDKIFIFNPADWVLCIFRNFHTYETGKDGSRQQGIIEAEIGLRLDNDHAAAVLTITSAVPSASAKS